MSNESEGLSERKPTSRDELRKIGLPESLMTRVHGHPVEVLRPFDATPELINRVGTSAEDPAKLEQSLKIGDRVVIVVTGETCERTAEVAEIDECELFYKHPRLKLLDAPQWVRLTLKPGDYLILRRAE